MRTSSKGVALIQSFEACALKAYTDQRGVWTIGWGHTGPEVVQGLVWTQQQADNQFILDLHRTETAVMNTVDIALTQPEFDALVSFTYNVGAGAEANSTLVRLLNAGNIQAAADQFLLWDHVNGVPNAGLARRRAAEQALFLQAA
jgi:lysozyme